MDPGFSFPDSLDMPASGGGDSGEGDSEGKDVDYDVGLMVFRILVCGAGTVGNLLVIFVILVLREYEKATTHWYVLQLAIADTIFLLTLPFKIVEDVNDEWIFTDSMCKLKETILFLNYYSSILFLTVMSIDRYVAVCHGLSGRLQKLRTNRAAYIITAVVWLTALVLCSPVIAYSNKMGHNPTCKCQYQFPNPSRTPEEICRDDSIAPENYTKCVEQEREYYSDELCIVVDYSEFEDLFGGNAGSGSETFSGSFLSILETTTAGMQDESDTYEMGCTYAETGPGWKVFLSLNFTLMFAIPLLLMTACYTLIILRLRQTRLRSNSCTNEEASTSAAPESIRGKKRAKRSKSAASAKAEKNRSRVTVMCAALVLSFLVCWLPYHSVHLAKMKGIPGSTEHCLKLSSVASLLGYLNSALNPYLYNFIGTRFSRRLRSATGSVKNSVKKRTSSLSFSGTAVRYHPRKENEAERSSSVGTVTTKIYKGKSDRINHPESSVANDVFIEDTTQSPEQVPLVDFSISPTPEQAVEKE